MKYLIKNPDTKKGENMQPTETLQERASQIIKGNFEESESPEPRVIWWDEGGYLKSVIRQACNQLDIGFSSAEGTPLLLRKKALEEPEPPQVWYVPEDKHGRDWFRDIKETGGEIKLNIEELAARLYENVQPWDIESGVGEGSRKKTAEVLLENLSEGGRIPTFIQLRRKLVTEGEGRPLEYILKDGWKMDRDQETLSRVRELLQGRNVSVISDDDDAEDIVRKVRKWIVADWLVRTGLSLQLLPEEYQKIEDNQLRRNPLKEVIKSNQSAGLDRVYLQSYWPEVISEVEDIWKLVKCPVEGNLEGRLWEDWIDQLERGDVKTCKKYAENRYHALSDLYSSGSAWSQIWNQARHLASLSEKLDSWEDRVEESDLVDIYSNEELGTWRIERLVRHLIVSGEPEDSLPDVHPATESLPNHRKDLLKKKYLSYLQRLSEITVDAFNTKDALTDINHAYQFWNDHKSELASGKTAVILYIDAFRLDLARELAEMLREDGYEVSETVRVGCLPSETKFGIASLMPGSPHSFKITLDNGELQAKKGGRNVTTNRRNRLLGDEGWEIPDTSEEGWSGPRIAYFDQEIDKLGHDDIGEIERKLSAKVDKLRNLIKDKLERGDWQRTFVVADHGFILLPEGTSMERISPPNGASNIARRWVSGSDLDKSSYGVDIGGSTSGIEYLDSRVKLLVNAFQRFKKEGISDSRYYHGGALPQEFVLNFLTVERE